MTFKLRFIISIIGVVLFSIKLSSALTSYFTAVSSKVIFPNSPYNITISLEPGSAPTTFTAILATKESVVIGIKSVEISPGTKAIIGLDVKDLLFSEFYNLTIKIEGEEPFEDSTRIHAERTDKSIFIQTDKQIYKPGEKVHIRVVVLNRFFKPFTVEQNVSLKILDPNRNVIKTWKDGAATKGLFSASLELSAEPNLGDWKIQTTSGDISQEASISVAQYVLPKYKVDLILPSYLTIDSSDLTVTVQAKYTYGQAIKGSCLIQLHQKPKYRGYGRSRTGEPKKLLSKTIEINGLVSVEFLNLTREFEITEATEFEIQASVKDELTGTERNVSSTIKLYEQKYKIEYVNQPSSFQPGLPLEMTFKVSTQDNAPVNDPDPEALQVKHGFSYEEQEAIVRSPIPPSGLVSLTFVTPANELLSVDSVEVRYKEIMERFRLPSRMQSETKIYLQLKLLTSKPKINEELELSLMSTKEFSSFTYLVYGRGFIWESEHIDLPSPAKNHKFKLISPAGAAPEGKILVYAMFGPKNEILADVVQLSLGSILQNNLDIKLSAETLEPGDELTISLNTTADSLIALRGVDQSLLLLKPDKDINMATIEGKLKELEKSRNERNRLSRGSSTFQVFDQAGLTVITNAILRRHRWDMYTTKRRKLHTVHTITVEEEYNYDMDDDDEDLALVKTKMKKKVAKSGRPEKLAPRIRTNFPETWMWEEISLVEGNSSVSLKRIVPDTLTSWIISGYSLNSNHGIGVTLEPQTLTTFRPFFITLNLPYSVVKGEVLSLQVLVHNYLAEDITAAITLRNDGADFEFNDGKSTNALYATEDVTVSGSDVVSVTFVIVPVKFGTIMLNVKGIANHGQAGDALAQPLLVRPPGQQYFQNKAVLVDLRSISAQEYNLTAIFPEKRVEGADSVKITVIADLLGTTISNLDKLLKMPCGCGEQNMLNFVPDIVILEYLNTTGMLTKEIETKAIKFLESGYQRELTYRHSDGSFSAFGSSDNHGSTWLTAFVVRSFVAAIPYITVDEKIIYDALEFLTDKQNPDGSFIESGRVLHSEMQGGASEGVALTAYTLLAFIESKSMTSRFPGVIEKGLAYLQKTSSQENGSDDLYALTLTAYAMHLANHGAKDQIFNKLKDAANSVSNNLFWEIPKKEGESATKPIDVEMTSYALLSYLHENKLEESLPIGKWLLKQRNSEGGFLSTQDTVVGLTALAKFAKITRGSDSTNIQVTATYGDGVKEIHVDENNAIVLQEFHLPASTKWVNFAAAGKGTALAQLTWSYYVEDNIQKPAFVIDVLTTHSSTNTSLALKTCVAYNFGEMSNMAVMEINVPSGYTFDGDELHDLTTISTLKRHELENEGTKLILYFDFIDKGNTCVRVLSTKAFDIEKRAPALILVYDYYDNTKRATRFYEI